MERVAGKATPLWQSNAETKDTESVMKIYKYQARGGVTFAVEAAEGV